MNYKVLPFTEENLRLEGAEVWHKTNNIKHIYVGKLKRSWLIHFEDGTYGVYNSHKTELGFSTERLEIRIHIKKLTREEAAQKAWNDDDYNDYGIGWDGLIDSSKKFYLSFAEAYHAMKVNGEVED